MLAQLIPADGGEPIRIARDVTIVGRKPGLCDLIIDQASISKLQCVLVKTDGLLFVRDLASTNGTRVNGQRVSRGALLPGDELAFAGIKYRVHLGPGDSQAEIAPVDQTELISGFPEPEDNGRRDRDNSDSDVRFLKDDSVT